MWQALLTGLMLSVFCSFSPLLAQQKTDRSDSMQQLFEEALELRSQGEYAQAVALLNQILEQNPELARARVELALTKMYAMDYAEARRLAIEVSENSATPESARQTISAFIEELDKQSQPHRISGSISVGLFNDNNTNAGPSSDTVSVNGLPITVAGLGSNSDSGHNLSASVSHRWLAPQTITLGSNVAAMSWNSTGSYYTTNHRDQTDYNLDVIGISTGPGLTIAGKGSLGITGVFQDARLGGKSYVKYTGAQLSGDWTIKDTTLSMVGRLQDRNFRQSSDQGQDSTYKDIEAAISRPIGSTSLTGFAGLKAFTTDASDDQFTNHGHEAYLGINWVPWESGQLQIKLGREKADYKDVTTGFTVARDETTDTATISLDHQFTTGYFKDWILGGIVTQTNTKSNVSFYDFKRLQTGITLSRRF